MLSDVEMLATNRKSVTFQTVDVLRGMLLLTVIFSIVFCTSKWVRGKDTTGARVAVLRESLVARSAGPVTP